MISSVDLDPSFCPSPCYVKLGHDRDEAKGFVVYLGRWWLTPEEKDEVEETEGVEGKGHMRFFLLLLEVLYALCLFMALLPFYNNQ